MSVKQFRKHLQKDEGYADTVWTIILSSVFVLSVVFIGVVGKYGASKFHGMNYLPANQKQ